jgi:hypothetical protein
VLRPAEQFGLFCRGGVLVHVGGQVGPCTTT